MVRVWHFCTEVAYESLASISLVFNHYKTYSYHSDERPSAESNFNADPLVVQAVASQQGSSNSSQSPAYVPEVTQGV